MLPLENIGGDPKDGIPQRRRRGPRYQQSLAGPQRNLKVRPFSSVSRYRGKKDSARTVGRELNVQAIVTGTLHQQGDDLSISVALVDAREDNQALGYRYQGKLSGFLICRTRSLAMSPPTYGLRLTSEEERRLAKRYTEDPEAYLLYREGIPLAQVHRGRIENRHRVLRARRSGKTRSMPLPMPGWGGVTSSGHVLPGAAGNLPEARKHLAKALALDDSLADAHYALD